jgi:hypothetical protein
VKTHNSDRIAEDNPIDLQAEAWARNKVAELNRRRVQQGLVPVDGDVLATAVNNLADAFRAGYRAAMDPGVELTLSDGRTLHLGRGRK